MTRITIKDIAKEAGVSTGTVDRILHDRGKVSRDKEKAILAAIKKLGYTPNMYASAMAFNQTIRISCLIPTLKKGGYWELIEAGLYEGARGFSDFHTEVSVIHYDPSDPASFPAESAAILAAAPNGVILGPAEDSQTLRFTGLLEKACIPYILIDSVVEGTHPLTFFAQNGFSSGEFYASILGYNSQTQGNKIVIFSNAGGIPTGSNQQKERAKGFTSFIRSHFPSIGILVVDFPFNRNKKRDWAILDKFFQEHDDCKIGVFLNSEAYITGEYLEAHPRPAFFLAGYDLTAKNKGLLERGIIRFLICQRPHEQGANAVKALAEYFLFKKKVPSALYVPIDIINSYNAAYYR